METVPETCGVFNQPLQNWMGHPQAFSDAFFERGLERPEVVFEGLDCSLGNSVALRFSHRRNFRYHNEWLVLHRAAELDKCFLNHSPNRALLVALAHNVLRTCGFEEVLESVHHVRVMNTL